MKTVKRAVAVALLVVMAALVGYLVFTGSRLPVADDIGGGYEEVWKI